MNEDQLNDENTNEIVNKILLSNNKSKKMLLNENYIKEVREMVTGMSNETVKDMIYKKIEQIKQTDISEEQKDKLECELAILIANMPVDYEQNRQYWRVLEEKERKKRE